MIATWPALRQPACALPSLHSGQLPLFQFAVHNGLTRSVDCTGAFSLPQSERDKANMPGRMHCPHCPLSACTRSHYCATSSHSRAHALTGQSQPINLGTAHNSVHGGPQKYTSPHQNPSNSNFTRAIDCLQASQILLLRPDGADASWRQHWLVFGKHRPPEPIVLIVGVAQRASPPLLHFSASTS